MNLIEKFTVLEDGEPIGTFDTYEQAAADIHLQAIIGRRYQIVKEFITEEEKLPTVADTGWRDAYRGMWAEHKVTNKVFIMLDDDAERVGCFDNLSNMWGVKKEALCPRYDLAPVSLTPHPAYLETLEDYQNAPAHTIVGGVMWEDGPSYAKYDWTPNSNWSSVWDGEYLPPGYLKGTRRKVLYWPAT